MKTITYLSIFLACSFLFFGWACLATPQMKSEFRRYGLISHRRTVGVLQLLGGAGLLAGIYASKFLQISAAGGLALLMIFGFMVRLKIRDSLIQATPSLFYAVLNAYLFYLLLYPNDPG